VRGLADKHYIDCIEEDRVELMYDCRCSEKTRLRLKYKIVKYYKKLLGGKTILYNGTKLSPIISK
jgi:hypothetical protein